METEVGVYVGVLPASLALFWQLAQKELQKINMYKAPRDKLFCILNCCKVIGNLLLHASISSEDVPGADEFLPVLIYVTIKVRLNIYHCIIYLLKPYSYISRRERERILQLVPVIGYLCSTLKLVSSVCFGFFMLFVAYSHKH